VGAGPGDPDLITLRGIECLKQADVVVYDRLANLSLLAHARYAELIDVGKQPGRHPQVSQAQINALLVEKAQAGKVVVRLKGGDPCVFGRGGEEALALAEAGLPFEIVPGITSAIAAPAYAGIPVTQRDMSCSVAIITGHRAHGDNPRCDWIGPAAGADTLVFLMGVGNLPHLVDQLVALGRSPDTPIALVEQGTRTTQKTVVGTLANIVERSVDIHPPAVIIVGEVVRLRQSLRWFDRIDRRPLLGLRVLNTRPLDQAGELSRRLASLGAESVELPTTQVMPVANPSLLDDAITALAPSNEHNPAFDWIIFTSANSVFFFFKRFLALDYDVRTLAGVKLGAAGQATLEALQTYGLRPNSNPPYTSPALVAQISSLAGQRVLVPCSNAEWPDLVGLLRQRGASVSPVVTYAIQPAEPDPIGLAALLKGQVDVATFISASGLNGLASILKGYVLADVLAPLTVACIGPTTADAARAMGIRVDLVAQKHTIDGLIDTLLEWYGLPKKFSPK
jgi:uroporphyrinogen III methyltransferase/synthase